MYLDETDTKHLIQLAESCGFGPVTQKNVSEAIRRALELFKGLSELGDKMGGDGPAPVASPLPMYSDDGATLRMANGSTVARVLDPDALSLSRIAYVVHACNALPGLREHLRISAARIEQFEALCDDITKQRDEACTQRDHLENRVHGKSVLYAKLDETRVRADAAENERDRLAEKLAHACTLAFENGCRADAMQVAKNQAEQRADDMAADMGEAQAECASRGNRLDRIRKLTSAASWTWAEEEVAEWKEELDRLRAQQKPEQTNELKDKLETSAAQIKELGELHSKACDERDTVHTARLRGLEKLLEEDETVYCDLRHLLDDVDARDSLAYLERSAELRAQQSGEEEA